MNRTRMGWIDALRALAAVAVVLLHTLHGWLAGQPEALTGARYLIDLVFLDTAVRFAVPVFVMISGFLLLDPERDVDLKKIGRYVLRMIAVLATVGYAYCLIESVAAMGLSNLPALLVTSLKNLLAGESWAHMWYVYMLIGLYLLTPALRVFVKHAEPRTLFFTLAALCLLTIVRPTISALTGLALAPLIPVTEPYLFYYLLGSFLRDRPLGRKAGACLAALGAAGNMLLLILTDGRTFDAGYEFACVALLAVGLFALAEGSAGLNRLAQIPAVASLSRCALGIYLFHPFFLNVLNKGLHLYPGALPMVLGEAAFFAAALLGAWGATWALTKLRPFRWLLL